MLKCNKGDSQFELIQKKLDGGHEIQPFPPAVSRLLSAIKDQKANAETFADIIEMDVALATKILRMVNSPMYGFQNEVRSIKQAITILGRKPLKNLALTYAGAAIISGKNKAKEQCEALWNHSLGCATVARIMANSVNSVRSDDAFLAGIFHDIGKLFFLNVIPMEYANLAASNCGTELSALETELCGMNHVEVGLRLTVAWPLPDEIKGAIRYHHEPEADSTNNDLTALIHVSDGLARSAGIGSSVNQGICMAEKANQYFGLDQDALNSLQERAHQAFEETKQAFSS